jgi:hypothetical protein
MQISQVAPGRKNAETARDVIAALVSIAMALFAALIFLH